MDIWAETADVPMSQVDDTVSRHQAATKLLDTVIDLLRAEGWRKIAVDTYRDEAGNTVRHSYVNGDWELMVVRAEPGRDPRKVTWSRRDAELPASETVVNLINQYLHL